MNSIVNIKMAETPIIALGRQTAVILFDLTSETDRQTYIKFLKTLVPQDPADQLGIDRCIQLVGGTVEPGFPGYECMQQ